ncbi:hypothetical protein M378DRAFT_579427 [Amanita muscaria Koide BX008]|uniref:Uncharacterized protein n=1 Tax=Amanita muscaria (strain Koide BX008) TaxID=946122 RepID=A0A0C2SMZ2_AMAMK|nr:hypothetical protein M378DRAFT_579427 [Amanita muscaria Koide BX008]
MAMPGYMQTWFELHVALEQVLSFSRPRSSLRCTIRQIRRMGVDERQISWRATWFIERRRICAYRGSCMQAPKYIGPFRISCVASPGSPHPLKLPKGLKARGISLLRRHIQTTMPSPLDSRSGVLIEYSRILAETFEVQWTTDGVTWVPYVELRALAVLDKVTELAGWPRDGADPLK